MALFWLLSVCTNKGENSRTLSCEWCQGRQKGEGHLRPILKPFIAVTWPSWWPKQLFWMLKLTSLNFYCLKALESQMLTNWKLAAGSEWSSSVTGPFLPRFSKVDMDVTHMINASSVLYNKQSKLRPGKEAKIIIIRRCLSSRDKSAQTAHLDFMAHRQWM